MEKAGIKTRDIKFFSKKNDAIICVHSQEAFDYAKLLESADWVKSYEVNYPLDPSRVSAVNKLNIRKQFFETNWTSDFVIKNLDGGTHIREFLNPNDLNKRAKIEKIELSRRYWETFSIINWKIIMESEEDND